MRDREMSPSTLIKQYRKEGMDYVPSKTLTTITTTTKGTPAKQIGQGRTDLMSAPDFKSMTSNTIVSTLADVHAVCELDDTRFVSVYNNSTTIYAVVGTTTSGSTGITFGTPVTVATLPSGVTTVIVQKSSTDKVVVTYENTSKYPTSVVLSISTNVITVNTPVVIESSALVDNALAFARMADDTFIVCYKQSSDNQTRARIITVSGTTPSAGTASTVITSTSATGFRLIALSSTSAVVGYMDTYPTAVAMTRSTNTIASYGSPTVLLGGNALGSIVRYSDTSFIVFGRNISGSTVTYSNLCTLSGNTITGSSYTQALFDGAVTESIQLSTGNIMAYQYTYGSGIGYFYYIKLFGTSQLMVSSITNINLVGVDGVTLTKSICLLENGRMMVGNRVSVTGYPSSTEIDYNIEKYGFCRKDQAGNGKTTFYIN